MATKVQSKPRRINPSQEYNIQRMIEANAFPWLSGFSERHRRREYAEIIAKDSTGKNLLKAVRNSSGKRSEYLIKGRCLQRFIKKYELGIKLQKQRI